ncbi:MAG TPA: carboxyl transferase domain-containing protein [Candidatus Eisenbacteria bacterium]|nr:carboxyl transferase domain-containing protein [Candidatus Eisenbacteria bacterium]
MTPIRCIGVVNRGEAAMRCVRAVKALRAQEGSSLRIAVLYTHVDRDAPFVRHADAAVRLATSGGEVRAYLDHDIVMAALRSAGADAVWPGWGFVAEDPAFADRVVAAGMRFLGPSSAAMRALGDKIAAKQLAERAGVPVAAWSGGVVADAEAAARVGEQIGYPLVVKAAAGGGGRGIRIVDHPAALPAAFASAAAEAQAAFGDGRLFLERKVVRGRHVEVQIAGDLHGRVVALGTRDCSVQRRHQKVIEEAPPPDLSSDLAAQLAAAAVRLGREVGYTGLGTVEFLVTDTEPCFLEMNPRLQVEHGITEATTGLDLVQLQIRIARGERIVMGPPPPRGVAIEARVCAEDPDAGFLPSPGRVARFDPALGPGVRVDSGIAAGSVVPPAFDSLVAKVIATGATREEARSRLVCALRDLELVIEGGATNTGYLIDLLESPEFRAGGVDTGWVDRRRAEDGSARSGDRDAADALVAAAILAYQRRRHAARRSFFAESASMPQSRVPASAGQEIDLSFEGAAYRLTVFALGAWRYRVHMDGRAVVTTLREGERHLARLELPGRTRRIVYDATEVGLRLELDGRPYRFGWETTGHVRAPTPALVVAIQVAPGDTVEAGQVLGLLEAMKMEIGFVAPVAGVVAEVRVRSGERVAARDVLVVIEPASSGAAAGNAAGPRIGIEPAAELLELGSGDPRAAPASLAVLDRAAAGERRAAVETLREEIGAVLRGYDVDAARVATLVTFLESTETAPLSAATRSELAALRDEVVLFADVEQLFLTAPKLAGEGTVDPSNAARLRAYVRRMRAGGAGVPESFLALLRTALARYGVTSLVHHDALERAMLRLLATQNVSELRRQLVRAVLRCLGAVAGADLATDATLADALRRISAMRALVSDALADAAIETEVAIFEAPAAARRAEHAAQRIAPWMDAAVAHADVPHDVLLDLAAMPRGVFDRVGRWLLEKDPGRRNLALMAYLLRLYAPSGATARTANDGLASLAHVELMDGRVVVGGVSAPSAVGAELGRICGAIAAGRIMARDAVDAIELIVPCGDAVDVDAVVAAAAAAASALLPAPRCTLSFVRPGDDDMHRTLARARAGACEVPDLLDLHPEVASRIGYDRLRTFALERLPGAEDVYCFWGRSRTVPDDERLFVLAQVRGRDTGEGGDTPLHVAAFERQFHQATALLRAARSLRDPRRRLHWNRLVVDLAPAVALDREAVDQIARRLAPATRHLGLEKVIVQLRLGSPAGVVPIEVVVSDLTGAHMETAIREPRTAPLEPAGDYERNVVEARRRRLVYPYEILRMLTRRNGHPTAASFEEYDLDPTAPAPRAASVAGRPYGRNQAGIVFGVLSTPTDKVPEGLRRVLILSDPTRDMGALAAAECDRIVAAFDLAEACGLPVEWIPVSSGARIAMDSGTENLDATARVARRIVTFTEAGGVVHVVVYGVNVGAQSYWNALATMLGHTRGALVMTPDASMVLTGRAALEASGSVAAEDEVALGGFERIMGPNGEAQYYAGDLAAALRVVEEHYRHTYVVPGETAPRLQATSDPFTRDVTAAPYPAVHGHGFATVGEIFDDATNPGRKRPFAMRPVMQAVIDQDGGHLERWRSWAGAETAIVWDAHLGGMPISLIGIESHSLPRDGHRPADGPETWTGGTLFPQSSKKVARALNAASGNRPAVILANLSGFDGSPESLRRLQLEHGAEIARAVVRFAGPLLFVVVSRYHGGAYVVFSKSLNDALGAIALEGSYASVIGGAPAATVIFTREVRARAARDPKVVRWRDALRRRSTAAVRDGHERALAEAVRTAQAEVAAEFDAVHTVERACRVGSLDAVVSPRLLRPSLILALHRAASGVGAFGSEPRNDEGGAPVEVPRLRF